MDGAARPPMSVTLASFHKKSKIHLKRSIPVTIKPPADDRNKRKPATPEGRVAGFICKDET
jgi:hypothetical protein